MEPEESYDLHPLTPGILTALMESAPQELIAPVVDEALLAMFAAGWVTEAERLEAICALTDSEALRERLLEMRDELKAVSQGVEGRTALINLDPTLSRTLNDAATSLLGVLGRWRSVCASAISDADSLLAHELRSVQTILRQLGASLKNLPPAIAATRGETGGGNVSISPSRTQAHLTLSISPDGRLVANAELERPLSMAGELSLYIVGPEGEWIYLGSSAPSGLQWELVIGDTSELMGLPVLSIGPSCFALTEGHEIPEWQTVRLKIGNGPPVNGGGSSLWLTVTEPSSVENGVFRMGIELPSPLRTRLADATVVAVLDLGGSRFVLGEWRVKDMPNSDTVSLSAPLPAMADCKFELHSLVSLFAKRI